MDPRSADQTCVCRHQWRIEPDGQCEVRRVVDGVSRDGGDRPRVADQIERLDPVDRHRA